MNINEVNNNLEDIAERYQSDSFFHRMKKMIKGIKEPKNSKEYKEALIEGQRLSAPLSAIALPLLAILLLVVLSSGSKTQTRETVVRVLKPDKKVIFEEPEKKKKVVRDDDSVILDDFVLKPLSTSRVVDPPPQMVQDNQGPFVILGLKKGPEFVWQHSGIGSVRGKGVKGRAGKPTDNSVILALRWLKKNQNPDGSWNKNKSAMTGLAILTFLAHAETPANSDEFGDTVQKALLFLVNGQDKNTGLYSHQDGHQYSHPIATYAMCEAAAMTGNPNVKSSAELALVPIIRGQNPSGGWNYKMNPSVDKATGRYRDDTSYMGWCAQALKAAKMAGLKVDGIDKAIKLAVKGFKKNSNPNGGFGYTGPSATHGMTSVGTLCMQMLGAGSDSVVRKSLGLMDQWKIGAYGADNKVGGSPQYYFYYATQSKFHSRGKRWEIWDKEMQRVYLSAQRIEKNAIKDHNGKEQDIGWWENVDKHSDRPVMDTCLTALQLMVYHRYLPTMTASALKVDPEIIASLEVDPADITVVYPGNL